MNIKAQDEYYAKLFAEKDRIIALQKKWLNIIAVIIILLLLGLYPIL